MTGAEDNMVTLIEWTTVLSAVAGISATVLALLQLRHMDQHRDLEISLKLFDGAETDVFTSQYSCAKMSRVNLFRRNEDRIR